MTSQVGNISPSVLLCHGHVRTYSVLHLYFRCVFRQRHTVQWRLFGNCTYCDVCTETRVPLQTCIVSGRDLFTYPFKQHRIEPQDHARPWFGTSLLRVTTRTKGALASPYTPYWVSYFKAGVSTFSVKGSQLLLLAVSRAAHVKVAISGKPNRLHYCVIVYVS